MTNPYKAKSDAIDEEIRSMYPKGNEPDLTPDDNNDLSLDAGESNQDDMTGADESVPQEPNIPESKYKAAVVEMNKKQQEAAESRKEAAELRKRVAELEQQLSSQSTSESDYWKRAAELQQQLSSQSTAQAQEESEEESEDESSEMTADKQDFESLVAELEDIGLDEFVPILRLMNDKIEKCMAHTGKLDKVADDYIGYRKQLHTDAFWNAIREAHPDIQSFIPPSDAEYADYTPEQKQYADWYAEQPQEIKDLFAVALQNEDPQAAIEGLNKFRADVPSQAEENEEEAAPSVAVMVASKSQSPSKLEQAKAADTPKISKTGEKSTKFNRRLSQEEWHKLDREGRDAYNKWLDEQMF